jgi:uroporphyrin-III C-methyltransferase/precorrin-2 dehydrogenase/sirohydrochlorin ferrochelatase
VPAIVDRSPLMIAISSGGTAPMLARWVRATLEQLLDPSLGVLATLLAAWRQRIVATIRAPAARRVLYDALLEGEVADLVRAGRLADAAQALAAQLSTAATAPAATPRVALVGAGPGDPGLLTLNALRALQRADVILHDRLVSPAVLALARRDALRVSVGKESGGPSTTQDHIHSLLLQYARSHRYVVRLKGGDPLLFGRGGEELQLLQREGIAFEVIPGITAAVAAGAYAGIPLTHRDHAPGLRLLTAHAGEGREAPDWRDWARSRDTLAIYMGLGQCAVLSRELLRHGRAADTPVALIENASRPEQRVVLGRLDALHTLVQQHALQSPMLLIVGSVAGLADKLHWFGAAPIVEPAAECAA